MQLRPLNNVIIFQFLDETSGQRGEFTERSRSGLIIPKLQSTQKGERWGKVIATGPKVYGVAPGEFILIEPLGWTMNGVFEGQKYWMTNDQKVLLVTEDESLTIPY